MAATKLRSPGSGCLSQITTIFFDLDNTLIPTRKADAKACNKVLPYMFQLANSTFQESRQYRLENKGNPDAGEAPADVLRVMLPAMCHLAVEDKARQIIFKTKQDEALYECLVFHFSIAHWKRPPALEFLGVEWTLNDEEKPKQFFLLLLQLAAIEVRMQMDNKSFNQAAAQAELITACFIILEISVNYMATDQLDLDQKEKQQVYTALKGAFSGVMSVLTKLSTSEARNNLSGKDKSFAAAMVRVLAAWLAQETTAMRPGLYQVLPYMFQLANSTFQESRQYRLENKGNPDAGEAPADVLRVMLPAMCHLAVEDKARQIIFKTKQDEALYECLVFHFSIAHWKRPPVPRAERLKRLNEPDPGPTPRQQEEMKDSRAAIVSLCNIFMNLTVLEAKIAEESLLFSNLLRFIFENLPELKDTPDNLVMHGHLAVLGMLMLKQQAKKVKKNDFSICRYIQATIRFLWDAYIVDESNDPTALVVSIAYKEHWMEIMELWFLGMQTMSGVILQIPWISEFALESGWAEGIVETLKKVKIGTLPGNVKSAFEDLLCQLVEANSDVPAKLKKADALRVCRNHRMMELGKKLFDNEELPLEEWRCHLWSEALPEPFRCLSGEVYCTWLQLRLRYMTPTAETFKMLESLKAHFFLALITNGPSAAQWEKVNRLNVAKYFDCILVSGDLPWEKPDARIFHAACNLLGVQAHQCIMVGDKLETDIQGGKDAKLGATFWLPLTNAERAEPQLGYMPDFTIHNLSDMLAVLPCGMSSRRFPASRDRCSSIGTAGGVLQRSRVPYNRRVASLPDLDSCNSNSSDGS
uniref:Uncharacterized protein n=1 Tax=Lutzomyia longipalpis TaxID=7200 RepID=A0A1B0CRR9_LUTLO